MGWLITLGTVALLAMIPLGIRIRYDEDGFLLRLIAGPVRLTVYPRKGKPKKEKEPPKDDAEAQPQQALAQPPQPPRKPPEKKEKKGGSLLDFLPLAKLAVSLLGDFRRKLRLRDLSVRLILAGSDPCDLAVNYGKACAAAANLLPRLESWFVIKKKEIYVGCDFTASETLISARLDITITLGRLISLLCVYGVRALIAFLNLNKKRKGGAVT